MTVHIVLDVPIWTDERLVAADEALWAGLAILVAEHNAAVIAASRERGEDITERIYAERNGRPVTRWACDKRQTILKGVEAVARDKSGCCTDLAAFRAGECIADGEGAVEVALEDRTGKGRPYHAVVLINGEPEEPDVSEFFGMGETG